MMKTCNTRIKLIAMTVALAALAGVWANWPAHRVEAAGTFLTPDPFGLAQGQSARLTLLNRGQEGGFVIDWKFLDSDGNPVAELGEPVTVPTDQFRTFDVNGDALRQVRDRYGRLQVRAVVRILGGPDTGPRPRAVIEVFNHADGKTTVFCANNL